MDVAAVSCVFVTAILVLGLTSVRIFDRMIDERAAERKEFLRELRRQHYLEAGARPDEAANAVITEDIDRIADELAKSMPKSDTSRKSLDPPDVLELPNGVRIKREL